MNRETRLTALPSHDRPQERLERLGTSHLSDTELLAMLLRSGTAKMDVLELAQGIVAASGSLSALLHWSKEDFLRCHGIGKVKALQLLAIIELARRIPLQDNTKPVLWDERDVYDYMHPTTLGLKVEKVWVLCLDSRYRLIKRVEVTSGSGDSSLSYARDIFREALRQNAVKIFVVHNHPGGDPTPSEEDITITGEMVDAGLTLEIDFINHVVIGRPEADPRGLGYRRAVDESDSTIDGTGVLQRKVIEPRET